jgi:hypothetical protein
MGADLGRRRRRQPARRVLPRDRAEPVGKRVGPRRRGDRRTHPRARRRTVTALTLHADAPHVAGNAVACALFVTAVLASSDRASAAGSSSSRGPAAMRGTPSAARGTRPVGASTAIFGAIGILGSLQFGRKRGDAAPGSPSGQPRPARHARHRRAERPGRASLRVRGRPRAPASPRRSPAASRRSRRAIPSRPRPSPPSWAPGSWRYDTGGVAPRPPTSTMSSPRTA